MTMHASNRNTYDAISKFGVPTIVALALTVLAWVGSDFSLLAKLPICVGLIALVVIDYLLPGGRGLQFVYRVILRCLLGALAGIVLTWEYFSYEIIEYEFDPNLNMDVPVRTGKTGISTTGYIVIATSFALGGVLGLIEAFVKFRAPTRDELKGHGIKSISTLIGLVLIALAAAVAAGYCHSVVNTIRPWHNEAREDIAEKEKNGRQIDWMQKDGVAKMKESLQRHVIMRNVGGGVFLAAFVTAFVFTASLIRTRAKSACT